uniref:Uncharacterized protein n=1 Tax=Taeniopygia guttata TaxID=59729 RepID=A0A674HEW6_TAEGU
TLRFLRSGPRMGQFFFPLSGLANNLVSFLCLLPFIITKGYLLDITHGTGVCPCHTGLMAAGFTPDFLSLLQALKCFYTSFQEGFFCLKSVMENAVWFGCSLSTLQVPFSILVFPSTTIDDTV